jgi:A/G-specific adenine glycosylase
VGIRPVNEPLSRRLLGWFERHGRRDLPWQARPDPYRIWLSEIMLQQTQVATVIPYFHRFVARFPHVRALADAPLDEVLHLWSGLGYYARARNLHRAARLVREVNGGQLPRTIHALQALPGIGRSTAGAILVFAHGLRHPILDGNVKRVLCRYHAIDGWPGEGGVLRELWALAERHTPQARVADYTQAIMDLGATVCTRARPLCTACPLAMECAAHREGTERRYPRPKPPKALPTRSTVFVMARAASGAVLLERRPPAGVWGGLWSFPECPPEVSIADWCAKHLGQTPGEIRYLAPLRHTFSHFRLDITPALVSLQDPALTVLDGDRTTWYKSGESDRRGLPAPVARLLGMLQQDEKLTRR